MCKYTHSHITSSKTSEHQRTMAEQILHFPVAIKKLSFQLSLFFIHKDTMIVPLCQNIFKYISKVIHTKSNEKPRTHSEMKRAKNLYRLRYCSLKARTQGRTVGCDEVENRPIIHWLILYLKICIQKQTIILINEHCE